LLLAFHYGLLDERKVHITPPLLLAKPARPIIASNQRGRNGGYVSGPTFAVVSRNRYRMRESELPFESLFPEVRIERRAPSGTLVAMAQLAALETVLRREEESRHGLVGYHQTRIGQHDANQLLDVPKKRK
jgi:hypothetical protein